MSNWACDRPVEAGEILVSQTGNLKYLPVNALTEELADLRKGPSQWPEGDDARIAEIERLLALK